MFCPKCGKTIEAGMEKCPNCADSVDSSRFEGIPYTSAQVKITPDAVTEDAGAGYTRTTYTGMETEETEVSADSRTTYRPSYAGASAPEDVRREMRSDIENAEEAQRTADMPNDEQFRRKVDMLDRELELDDVDMSQFKAKPITCTRQAGISRDVAEYISQLESDQERKSTRKSSFTLSRKKREYDDTDEGAEEARYSDYEQNEEEQSGDDEDEDYEEGGLMDRLSNLDMGKLTKVAVALVLVAALFVGGVVWIRYISKKTDKSPIEGVTMDFYTNGIAQIEANASGEHISELMSKYNNEGLLSMNAALTEDTAAIAALIPQTPAANDQTFLSALNAIETNIGNAVTMDVLAQSSASDTASADSAARWQVVNSSIASLKAATSAAELTGIINGQQITVASSTPVPIETAKVYATLSYGDKSDAVLDLQNRLYELGFFTDDRDGAYGNKTMTAVKTFQQTVGLSITGIADDATQQKLYADDAPYTQLAPKLAQSVTVTPEPGAQTTPAAEETSAVE